MMDVEGGHGRLRVPTVGGFKAGIIVGLVEITGGTEALALAGGLHSTFAERSQDIFAMHRILSTLLKVLSCLTTPWFLFKASRGNCIVRQ